MGLFSKSEAYLGVDIGAHGIKVVELHKTKGRPQLWTYGLLDEELDIHIDEMREKTPEELLVKNPVKGEKANPAGFAVDEVKINYYADLLKNLLKQTKVTTKKVTASLPVSYVFHSVVTLPRVEDKEIEHMVMAEVKKMLPRPIEEMQIVWQKIPETKEDLESKYLRILVTSAPKELVRFYSYIFQKAGLELQELETEAFALERSLVGHDKAIMMVVDIGAERTNFFIIDQSLPLIHRSINLGGRNLDNILKNTLDVDESLVGQIKKDLSKINSGVNYDLFSSFIDPIIKEIEYSFDLFLNQTGNQGKKPEKIVLTGGPSVLPFIKERLAKEFPIKVFVGDPWARVVYQDGIKTLLDTLGPRMSVAIGLALRNIND
ncbi:MAG: type IV pilus assembly protein PilM [Candidatus Magasanikiibacteriota bacterium]